MAAKLNARERVPANFFPGRYGGSLGCALCRATRLRSLNMAAIEHVPVLEQPTSPLGLWRL